MRDDVKLSEEAQNAQRAEMERRMRLQIEQQGHVQAAQPTLGDAEVTPDFFTPQSAAFSSYDGKHMKLAYVFLHTKIYETCRFNCIFCLNKVCVLT